MRTEDMVIVSVDDHVVEPPDVFEGRLEARYRELAPRLEHLPDGTDVWRFLDIDIPNVGLNAVAGRPKDEYGIDPTSFDDLRPGTYDVHERLKDMDANGVLGSMNFPSLPGFAGRLFSALDDKDAAYALTRAYNDWHIDAWCAAAPERFIPLAIPAIWSAEQTAAEIRRVAAKGCHALTFPENPVPLGLPSLHSEFWFPVWEACSDTGTVVCMHIGSSSKLSTTAPDAPIDVMITLQPMNIVQCAADLIFSPLWKQYPDVSVALSEGGIGWVPYFLERLDATYDLHHAWTGADLGNRRPSDVFLEHVILCFIKDRFGARHIREIGSDRVCVEIDYPHSDAMWPDAPEIIAEHFAATDLAADEIDLVTHGNAMRFFQYDPFATLTREQCTVAALRARAAGHDVSIRAKGKRHEHRGAIKISELNPTA
jgi:predicted TIM-barrel fold metal-dependent hydrolase